MSIRLVLIWLGLLNALPSAAVAQTVTYTLVGAITDDSNRPIAGASVGLFDNDQPLLASYVKAARDGSYTISEFHTDLDHVLMKFSAPGYDTQTRNVILSQPTLNYDIKLTQSKLLTIVDSVVSHRDARLDNVIFTVQNASNGDVNINSLQAEASITSHTTCLDAGPAVVFRVDELIQLSSKSIKSAQVIVRGPAPMKIQTTPMVKIPTVGNLSFHDECGVSGYVIPIPYLIHLAAHESVELGIELPRDLTVAGKTTKLTLAWMSIATLTNSPANSVVTAMLPAPVP